MDIILLILYFLKH